MQSAVALRSATVSTTERKLSTSVVLFGDCDSGRRKPSVPLRAGRLGTRFAPRFENDPLGVCLQRLRPLAGIVNKSVGSLLPFVDNVNRLLARPGKILLGVIGQFSTPLLDIRAEFFPRFRSIQQRQDRSNNTAGQKADDQSFC